MFRGVRADCLWRVVSPPCNSSEVSMDSAEEVRTFLRPTFHILPLRSSGYAHRNGDSQSQLHLRLLSTVQGKGIIIIDCKETRYVELD